MPESDRPVVVGVDGSPACLAAVRYAAAEATRLGVPLRLVHAAPDHSVLARLSGGRERVDQVAREALARAEDVVTPTPERPVEAEIRPGTPVAVLHEAAQDARTLVVGNTPHARLGRVVTGSSVAGLAARAVVPLVCVPSSWRPGPTHDRVIVGLKGADQGADLLERAFACASERGSRLDVVHAWRLPGEYDDLLDSPERLEQWRRHTLDEIEPLLAEGRRRYPQVAAQLLIRHDQAAHALLEAAADADLVMLARRPHSPLHPHPHLGGTARAVLREAPCPVEIWPPDTRPDAVPAPRREP